MQREEQVPERFGPAVRLDVVRPEVVRVRNTIDDEDVIEHGGLLSLSADDFLVARTCAAWAVRRAARSPTLPLIEPGRSSSRCRVAALRPSRDDYRIYIFE